MIVRRLNAELYGSWTPVRWQRAATAVIGQRFPAHDAREHWAMQMRGDGHLDRPGTAVSTPRPIAVKRRRA